MLRWKPPIIADAIDDDNKVLIVYQKMLLSLSHLLSLTFIDLAKYDICLVQEGKG